MRRGLFFIAILALAACTARATGPAQAVAKVEDTMAQRVQACTGCHGPQGRAASDGYYPRIAGKPAGYLYNQLLSFRDGRRQYGLMNQLLSPLTDDYLREIAQHFASLDVAYPKPQVATTSVDALSRGETLVLHGDAARRIPACVQCHGKALLGVAPAIPALIGMPRDYLNAQLGAWRTGNRQALAPDCMARIAKALAPEDIGALSQWLAAQPVPRSAKLGGAAGAVAGALADPSAGAVAGGSADGLATPLPIRCGGVPDGAAKPGAKPGAKREVKL